MKEIDTLTTVELPEDRFGRIGTTYYKLVRQPNAAGQLVERSIPWTIEAIRQDLFINIRYGSSVERDPLKPMFSMYNLNHSV